MTRAILHPRFLRTLGLGFRQADAEITQPGPPAATATGGSAPGTPTIRHAPAYYGQTSYQARERVFGTEAAAYVAMVAFLPPGTPIGEGWMVAIDGVTYSAVMPHTSALPGAPLHVGLVDRRVTPNLRR